MTYQNEMKNGVEVLLPPTENNKPTLTQQRISGFWMAGISYKKTDALVRGLFTITNEQYVRIIALSQAAGISEVVILSTCNRTEIYGLAADVSLLIQLLCTQTTGTYADFQKYSYTRGGYDAVTHLMNVSA